MKHRVVTSTFGRKPNHRRMLMKQLVTNVIEHGRITTTLTRAKALRPLVDSMITCAKDGGLSAKREARRYILNKEAFKRLFGEIRTDFTALPNQGGYSRIIRWKNRRGDNAPLVFMELINYKAPVAEETETKGKTKKTSDEQKPEKTKKPRASKKTNE